LKLGISATRHGIALAGPSWRSAREACSAVRAAEGVRSRQVSVFFPGYFGSDRAIVRPKSAFLWTMRSRENAMYWLQLSGE
jgi:hypothetical protein